MLAPIERWLDAAALSSIYSSQYWNDLSEEKSKEWWIADGTESAFARLRGYLEQSGLLDEYRVAERFVARLPGHELAIADLAAGIGWTSSLLSRLPNVATVHAVEISEHRLELLFPQAIRMFAGAPGKVRRSLGSFYNLGLANESLDVVFLASAFHHAANPLRLLSEADRVLKPGGHLILSGENVIGTRAIVRRMFGKLLRERRFVTNFYELFPPDDTAGDHYYRSSDYYLFNQLLGYRVIDFNVSRQKTATVISTKLAV
ncbi:MAG: class I SAM-dependent methyltransferase [Proteobacteria bacterium]|nr:class I SAM-dependent methyltransferase [Pseudomonadota bacterium]